MRANRNNITLKRATGSGGFSLVEVVVVMAMFMVVIMISTSAFNNILSGAKQQMKSSESNIEGVVGLEVFR
jgi:Tfp pilus assembly protein FimT